jgi:hypothetical protein
MTPKPGITAKIIFYHYDLKGPVWGVGTNGRGGEDIRKGCRRVNVVEYYAHMYVSGKMRPVETIPGIGGG